jgi:hypothetical protein
MAISPPSLLVTVVVKLFELIKVEDFITNASGLNFLFIQSLFFVVASKCNFYLLKYSCSLK